MNPSDGDRQESMSASDPIKPDWRSGSDPGQHDNRGLLEFLNVLLRNWKAVFAVPAGAAVLAAVISLVLSPRFTAVTTFVPETRTQTRLPPGIAGLAGQFGIPLGGDASQSPRFYAKVAKSREILEQVLQAKYEDPRLGKGSADSAPLLVILAIKGGTHADSLHNGVRVLGQLLSIQVDNQTNIVTVSAESRYPALSSAIANQLVVSLNEFNTRSRESQARERRRFAEERLAETEHELRSAEDQLKRFYLLNRSWQQAPQLVFEEGRLRRQVDIQQELYLTLRREYETARLEEVNDTPVLTVIDLAVPPSKRSYPKRKLFVLTVFVLSAVVGTLWAVANDYFERLRRTEPDRYERSRKLARAVGRPFARP